MVSLKKFHIKCINYCLQNGLTLDENIILNYCESLDCIYYCEKKVLVMYLVILIILKD